MYQRIMVPLDGSDVAECVLPHVEIMAKGCSIPEVILVSVVEPITPYVMTGEPAGMIPVEQLQAIEQQQQRATGERREIAVLTTGACLQ